MDLRNRTQVLWKKQPVLLVLPLQPSTPFPVFNIRWSLAEAGPSPPHTWPYHSHPSPPGNLLHSRPPACPSFLHSHQPLQKHDLTPYLSCHPKTTHTTLVCVPVSQVHASVFSRWLQVRGTFPPHTVLYPHACFPQPIPPLPCTLVPQPSSLHPRPQPTSTERIFITA